MTGPDSDLFDRARRADIGKILGGITLYRAGRRLRGPCPLCGASAGKRADGAFSVDPAAGVYFCFAEGQGGDVVDLYARLHSLSPREAAVELAGETWKPLQTTQAVATRAKEREPVTGAWAVRWWRDSQPALGSPVATYLYSRGIRGPVAAEALRHLRYLDSAWWGYDKGQEVHLPAMIARVVDPAGKPTGGIHVTYLRPDFTGKTARSPAKRMLGPQNGLAGAGGCVLAHDASNPDGAWLIGEGIESTLSAAMLLGVPTNRVIATLSLRALQGGILIDRWGRIDPSMPTADPERTPFVSARPRTVYLAVDRDMGPLRVKVRKAGGGSTFRTLDADERARICGALAESAWRKAGAAKIETVAPGPGRDFNDELRAARIGEGVA